jgi:hypothetical protein
MPDELGKMMINPIGSFTAHAGSTAASKKTAATDRAPTPSVIDDAAVAESTNIKSASVTLSGRSIMLSRLLHTQNANAPPPVVSASGGLTRDHLSQNPVDFLTEKDRSLVSEMYAYAQQQGSDLTHVDTIAITLGTYRQFDNGKSLGGFNESQFDSEGHQLSASYSASDTTTANRILNSDAIKSTRLDPQFLSYILQPTHSLSNMANVDFMAQMVTKFSDKGTEATSLDPKFATFTRKDSAVSNVVITASKEVIYKAPETQIANINGHWFILDPSILKDPSALKATGLGSTQIADAKRNKGIVALALLDVDPKKSNDVTVKLLDMLGKNKQPLML